MCVTECDRDSSIMRWPWLTRGCRDMKIIIIIIIIIVVSQHSQLRRLVSAFFAVKGPAAEAKDSPQP